MTEAKSKKTRLTGKVIKDSADKTVIVRVVSVKRHPKYKKQYTVHQKFTVHDENNQAKVDDKVEIEESTPKSKTKKWVLVSSN